MAVNSELLRLSHKVSETTSELVAHLENLNYPELSFSIESTERPSDKEYRNLCSSLNDAILDLQLLVHGPKAHAREFLCTQHDMAAYQVAFDFDFFNAVPEEKSIELSTIANKVGLDQDRVGRILRLMCTQHVFTEVSHNRFAHTGGSIIFARDKQLKAAGDYQLDEFFKAASETATSIRKATVPGNVVKTPFEERHGKPLFQFYGENPKLAARFANAMAGVVRCMYKPVSQSRLHWLTILEVDRQIEELRDGFPWDTIKTGKVIDMGGGSGHISVALLNVSR